MDTQIKTKAPILDVINPQEIPHILEEGELNAVLEWKVFDPKTNIVQEHKVKRSESFVQAFMQLLYLQFLAIPHTANYPLIDTSNATHYFHSVQTLFAAEAGIASILYGIVVGTDNTAPTITNYHLGTIILHDAAPPTAGRMQYSAMTFGAPSSDATTSQFTLTRNFANASGGAITVNEIGLYVKHNVYTTSYYFMTIRDVIAGGIAVPNGQTLTINYRPQAVV